MVLLLYRVSSTIIIEFLISSSLTEVKKFFSLSFISLGVKLYGNLMIIAPGCLGYLSVLPKPTFLVIIILLFFRAYLTSHELSA